MFASAVIAAVASYGVKVHSAGARIATAQAAARAASQAHAGWTLTWSDEFNGPDGSPPDPTKWTYDIGGDGWGNQELETYTGRSSNAEIRGGNLVITARKETLTDAKGVTRDYTSARLKTQGVFTQQYGRFESRIKIPAGEGMWPAFWLLGANIDKVGWPHCGEVDIMENIGKEPDLVHGSLHSASTTKSTRDFTAPFPTPPDSPGFADDFHVYAVEWDAQTVKFFVDGQQYGTVDKKLWTMGNGEWAFDQPFFVILNLAVGGNWPGPPDKSTKFPKEMLVDYVRVYKKS